MEIKEEHKELLRGMGLKDKDFELFDGRFVTYEFSPEKGVRLYDPYYATSYNEYIGIDGWSAWSSEGDDFMSNILKEAKEKARKAEVLSRRPDEAQLAAAMAKKFAKKQE